MRTIVWPGRVSVKASNWRIGESALHLRGHRRDHTGRHSGGLQSEQGVRGESSRHRLQPLNIESPLLGAYLGEPPVYLYQARDYLAPDEVLFPRLGIDLKLVVTLECGHWRLRTKRVRSRRNLDRALTFARQYRYLSPIHVNRHLVEVCTPPFLRLGRSGALRTQIGPVLAEGRRNKRRRTTERGST